MFEFIVKYFGFLKGIPFLPHLFDSMQKVWMILLRPEIPVVLDEIEAEILTWPGVKVSSHRFGGLEFNLNNKEFGHIHSTGILDIRFNKMIKQELMAEERISNHHVFPASGWISFYIVKADDKSYAISLLKRSYARLQQKINPVGISNTSAL